MRIAFLDSQTAFWLASGDKRLSPASLSSINSHSQTLISSLTIAELEMKAAIGRLPLPENLVKLFESAGVTVQPFSADAAMQLRRFPQLNRHDPFDRMILAQAASNFGANFFTSDEALIRLGLDWVVAV